MNDNDMRYQDMSNSELKIKLIEMENEYDVIKKKIDIYIQRMNELDEKYIKVKDVLNKRTKGMML